MLSHEAASRSIQGAKAGADGLAPDRAEGTLAVENLRVEFAVPSGTVKSVDGVSFTVDRGKVLCIVGESGSGKSVTARAIMGLVAPPGRVVEGRILLNGQDLGRMSERKRAGLRGDRISMIFQNPMTSLNPAISVGDQVAESLILHRGMGKADARKEARSLLQLVGIPDPDRRASDYPNQFSGGMRQRIMIAIALSCKPEVLIADEPTTALDVSTQAQILWLLKDLQAKVGNVLVMITHDLGVVASIADDVLVMYSGRVVEKGPLSALFADPRHPYTQGLLQTVRALEDPAQPLNPIPGAPALAVGERNHCPFAPRCAHAVQRCRDEQPLLERIGPEHAVACHIRPAMEPVHE